MAKALEQDTRRAGARSAAAPRHDHWTARQTVIFTAATSALLWMLLLRGPALF
jgi:hypothetical protein